MRNKIKLGNLKRRIGRLPFSVWVFQFYWVTKGFLTFLNEHIGYSLSDHPNLNEFTALFIRPTGVDNWAKRWSIYAWVRLK